MDRLRTRGCFVFLVAAMFPACEGNMDRGSAGVGVLSVPSDAAQHLSSYQPKNPYGQLAPGLLGRTVYDAEGTNGVRIAVTEYLVGPKQHSSSVTLAGATVFEVMSGDGVVRFDSKEQKVQAGTTFALPKDTAIVIENNSDSPLAMQLNVVRVE